METVELYAAIARGEDSKHQFKRNITNIDALASEMVAFSNAFGGFIFIGVSDNRTISGLTPEDISRLNQLISNAASQNVRPAINPLTSNILTDQGLVLVLEVPQGINKPYQDKDGVFWVKSGSDKRRATSREEIQRMFQSAGLVHADELPVRGLTIADIDIEYFKAFFQRRFEETLDERNIPLEQTIHNMNLGRDGFLNLTGALLFAKSPHVYLPQFIVKAGSFPGTTITTETYLDSRDIVGKLGDVFIQTRSFILANIKHIQANQSINSTGTPVISAIALEEIIANALVHRDYFISAPIRVFVFSNRVEIISPGHLPNNLSIENIKSGNSNARNPIIASFANQILPYRGYGSGILRALKAHPSTELIDDRTGNLFKVIFWIE